MARYHPELKEIYAAKEAVRGLYRVNGYNRAKHALQAMIEGLIAEVKVKEVA